MSEVDKVRDEDVRNRFAAFTGCLVGFISGVIFWGVVLGISFVIWRGLS